ncbi:MAG: hypothetical protein ACM3ZE_28670, partial [Myxococcales bacterium]
MPPRRPTLPLALVLRSVLHRTRIIDLSVGAFLGLVGLAIALYRGGTWWDRSHRGYSFLENFLCDLLHHRTLGGHPNLVNARLALMGMLTLAIGIITAFSLAPELIPARRQLGRSIAWFGGISTGVMAAAPVLRSDAYPRLHSIAVVGGSVPTLFAFAILVGALLLEPAVTRAFRAVSLSLLVLAVAQLALYAWDVFFGGPSLRLLPGLEHVASALLIVWLLIVVLLILYRLITAYL